MRCVKSACSQMRRSSQLNDKWSTDCSVKKVALLFGTRCTAEFHDVEWPKRRANASHGASFGASGCNVPWLAAEKLSVIVLVALAHGRCWPIFPARGRLTNFDLNQKPS